VLAVTPVGGVVLTKIAPCTTVHPALATKDTHYSCPNVIHSRAGGDRSGRGPTINRDGRIRNGTKVPESPRGALDFSR